MSAEPLRYRHKYCAKNGATHLPGGGPRGELVLPKPKPAATTNATAPYEAHAGKTCSSAAGVEVLKCQLAEVQAAMSAAGFTNLA